MSAFGARVFCYPNPHHRTDRQTDGPCKQRLLPSSCLCFQTSPAEAAFSSLDRAATALMRRVGVYMGKPEWAGMAEAGSYMVKEL